MKSVPEVEFGDRFFHAEFDATGYFYSPASHDDYVKCFSNNLCYLFLFSYTTLSNAVGPADLNHQPLPPPASMFSPCPSSASPSYFPDYVSGHDPMSNNSPWQTGVEGAVAVCPTTTSQNTVIDGARNGVIGLPATDNNVCLIFFLVGLEATNI